MAQPERSQAEKDQAAPGGSAAAIRNPGESSSDDARPPLDAATVLAFGESPAPPPPRRVNPSAAGPFLHSGTLLGQRYEILEMLGQGGMGAVYKAFDREVNQVVALKVIHPDLADNPTAIERFRQELILARQVTHRNVIRIYDLAEADGLKFITMEFVHGTDLHAVISKKGKLPPNEAVEIMQQVCRALEAAHAVGVIHRDLKPQNIMRDNAGRVLVMDFGVARSIEGSGMTKTGAMVGTLEYMSPEQAFSQPLDQRSDLFTAGLIFYQLLAGKMPYGAESAVASLIKRTQESAAPLSDEDSSIPATLSAIVSKCLERDAKLRFQTATELLDALEQWQDKRPKPTLEFPLAQIRRGRLWRWIAVAMVLVALASLGIRYRGKVFPSKPVPQAVAKPERSLAILPFRNTSGDASLDWLGSSLAEMLSTDIGQSPRFRMVSPDRLQQVLSDLRISRNSSIEPTMLARIAEFSSADTVISGQFSNSGGQIRIEATLQELKQNRHTSLSFENMKLQDMPSAVERIAESIRTNLSLSPDVLDELKTNSYQPTSKSPDALRSYSQGLQALRQGRNLDALKSFQGATTNDPKFALALSKLAETYSQLGYDNEAEQASRRSVALTEDLSPFEKYLIEAQHFRIEKDHSKAIEAYQHLATVSPDDPDIQFGLGSIYEKSGDFAKSRQCFQKLLQENPKDLRALVAAGRLEILTGSPEASLEPLNRALTLAVQLNNREQEGTVLHLFGAAYSYLNKPDEALQNYKHALEIRQHLGDKKGIADSLNMIAETYDSLGKSDLAIKEYKDALQIYREIGDQQDIGNVLGNVGQYYDDRGKYDDALKLFKEALQIHRDLHNENNEGIALNNIGNTYLFKGDYDNARTYFEQALLLREKINVPGDIAETVHNLAEVSTKSGQYEQALSQYMRGVELFRTAGDKRGAAVETYSMGTIFEYQGRYGSAESSKKQALQDLRDAKENSFWMGEALGGYGNALSEAGRLEEGATLLREALAFSRGLKNDALIAQTLNWQGDNFYYRGDQKSAKSLYEQALRAASKTADRHLLLVAKFSSAKIMIEQGQAQSGINALQGIAEEAETLGLKYLSIECSILEAQARMQLKDYMRTRPQLERAALLSENLGVKPLLMRAHFLLGKSLREQGAMTEAIPHFHNTVDLLQSLQKDTGAEKIMERSDLKSMYVEASRWIAQRSSD